MFLQWGRTISSNFQTRQAVVYIANSCRGQFNKSKLRCNACNFYFCFKSKCNHFATWHSSKCDPIHMIIPSCIVSTMYICKGFATNFREKHINIPYSQTFLLTLWRAVQLQEHCGHFLHLVSIFSSRIGWQHGRCHRKLRATIEFPIPIRLYTITPQTIS
jgi:hypothetical protein